MANGMLMMPVVVRLCQNESSEKRDLSIEHDRGGCCCSLELYICFSPFFFIGEPVFSMIALRPELCYPATDR